MPSDMPPGRPSPTDAVAPGARPLRIALFRRSFGNAYEESAFTDFVLPGFLAAGDDAWISDRDYEDCDVAVISYSPRLNPATNPHRAVAARRIRHLHAENLLIVEDPLLRDLPVVGGKAGRWMRFGFDHVHRGARFAPESYEPGRGERIGIRLQPWRLSPGPVFVAGQVAGDYSLDGVDCSEWAENVIGYLREAGLSVVYRPHPKQPDVSKMTMPPEVEVSLRPLVEDLSRAGCWVSLTSGSAIDAVLAGVRSVTLSPASLAWDVSHHRLEHLDSPVEFDRTRWLDRIAHCQWTYQEMRDGHAWAALRPMVRAGG